MDRMALVRRSVAWCLLAATLLYLLTGFGITYWGIVTPLTLGLLGKALAFQIHNLLWVPFGVLLVVHVAFGLLGRRRPGARP